MIDLTIILCERCGNLFAKDYAKQVYGVDMYICPACLHTFDKYSARELSIETKGGCL